MVAEISITDWFASRESERTAFLRENGWDGKALSPVGEDCAFRRYFRVSCGKGTRILMEAVPDGHEMATPGHSLDDFVRISTYLRDIGVNAPEIFAADHGAGYLMLQDFGDRSFKVALNEGTDRVELYSLATDVLAYLRDHASTDEIVLPDYYESHVHKGRRRIVDWFMPLVRGEQNPDGLAEDYLAVWDEIESKLPPVPMGFLHIDYHFENLMLVDGHIGLMGAGILDFQGAMRGPVPYDLANLLEDARVTVPQELREEMLERFCSTLDEEEKELFLNWYRVLATQFHCRVAGQFIRLALRDGKDRYLQHVPRVTSYIKEALDHPVLAPLAKWFEGQQISFDRVPDITPDAASLIRKDAF